MFTLKCDLCGYEQTIKKKLDKETKYELTHCKELRCNCNKCKNEHDYSTPKGYIQRCMVFGNWSTINIPTVQEMQSIKRAKEILRIGLEQLGCDYNNQKN